MRFEDKFKNEMKRELRERADKFAPHFKQGDQLSGYTKDIFSAFGRILDEYNYQKYRDTKSDREIWDIGEEFENCFTEDKLKDMYEKTNFSEEELNCVRYVELTRKWLNDYMRPVQDPITDILLRRELIKQYGQETMSEFVKIMQEEIPTSDMMARKIYKHLSKLFSGELYSEMHDTLEKTINDMTEEQFLNKINCGGYALNIDTCVFPFGYEDFSKNVSAVLERFSFTRLLGDKPLADDEYLVLYRANEDGRGHHFVRIDDDNILREKDAIGKEREFESWKKLEGCKEAVFAVKKEHTMFGYDITKVNSDGKEGLNFEETINKAIHDKHNTFNYHGHEYSLKKSQEGEILVASGNSIVADVLIDDGECIAEIREDKESYVENHQPRIGLVIKNGKLMNREQISKNREIIEDDEER